LHRRLGCVPLERIRIHPAPGTATEADVLAALEGEGMSCELVDGVLVEKAMGYYESWLAVVLLGVLARYMEEHDLGIVLGEAGALKLAPELVRIPDVSFLSWDRFPNRELLPEPIPALAPDLAVEVWSRSNTEAEMERKLEEYFTAGARLVWYVYPETRSAKVYTSAQQFRVLHEDDVLDGGDVLPGFRLTIRDWFERARTRASKEGEGEAS
jgi:Uma2 family endonuclease